MKDIVQRTLLLLAAAVCMHAAAAPSAGTAPAVTDSILNPAVDEEAGRKLEFVKTVVPIGTMTEDDSPVSIRFVFRNTGADDVCIQRVAVTCGCTLARHTSGAVPPGKEGEIIITFSPLNHPGTIDTSAFVYLSSHPHRPAARLTLLGTVLPGKDVWSRYPYAIGRLRAKRQDVEFRSVSRTQEPSERILCGNSGTAPLRPRALTLPSFATFRSEPEVIEPGCEADLVITIRGSEIPPSKGQTFTFPLVLDGVGDARPGDRTVTVRVEMAE